MAVVLVFQKVFITRGGGRRQDRKLLMRVGEVRG
jgi:hypothetical protein